MKKIRKPLDIIRILESEDYKKYRQSEELDEMSTTAGVDGYNTPFAFSKDSESHEEHVKDGLDQYGYSIAPKSKKKNSITMESRRRVNEASYREFKSDSTRPLGKKINDSILHIDRSLREIERAVRHASRLKNESNFDQRSLWKSSKSRLVKIHDKLVRIGKQINELGA